jgi:hypothetical protein
MTSDRADAYQRVTTTLRDMGAAKLWPAEQGCIRDAADTLLFCEDLHGEDGRAAFASVAALSNRLVDAGRWTDTRARQLLDDIWACGPGAAGLEAIAA